jgi:hypothetical protein
MTSLGRWRRDVAVGADAWVLSAVAAAVYYPLAVMGPDWWHGAVLPDMDPPFDLGWLHEFFAWTAGNVGQVLLWVFAATLVLLPLAAIATTGFSTGPRALQWSVVVARIVPTAALAAVPALAVGWFLLSQIAFLIASWLGMYHGDAVPAVP